MGEDVSTVQPVDTRDRPDTRLRETHLLTEYQVRPLRPGNEMPGLDHWAYMECGECEMFWQTCPKCHGDEVVPAQCAGCGEEASKDYDFATFLEVTAGHETSVVCNNRLCLKDVFNEDIADQLVQQLDARVTLDVWVPRGR